METFFASCPRGLEDELAHECEALGVMGVHVVHGGVSCHGPFSLCYRLNLESRLASRILWKVGHGSYRHEDDLYRLAMRLPWPTWFPVSCRIKVRVIAQRSPLHSLEFATLRVKDAICDRFVREAGARPEIDKRHPDIQIVVFVDEEQVIWYIDTTGPSLFKRGWRQAVGQAPLRENLAAGVLRLTGWTKNDVLLDPMCGAGTFLIEAALVGHGIPPGQRRDFAFRNLSRFDQSAWNRCQRNRVHPLSMKSQLKIFGYDQDGQAVAIAKRNCQHVGIADIQLKQGDVLEICPPAAKGVMVTNPPYGVRISNQATLEEWYPEFGNVLKQRFVGWKVYILTADFRLPKHIRLAPSRKIPLFNGALESRLYEFLIVKGSNRKSARLARHHSAR